MTNSCCSDGSGSDSVFPSLEGTAAAEPVALNMAISTLYLHDMIQRRNLQQRRNQVAMPGISESPDENVIDQPNSASIAAAALASVAAAAFENATVNIQMSKSNLN